MYIILVLDFLKYRIADEELKSKTEKKTIKQLKQDQVIKFIT